MKIPGQLSAEINSRILEKTAEKGYDGFVLRKAGHQAVA